MKKNSTPQMTHKRTHLFHVIPVVNTYVLCGGEYKETSSHIPDGIFKIRMIPKSFISLLKKDVIIEIIHPIPSLKMEYSGIYLKY